MGGMGDVLGDRLVVAFDLDVGAGKGLDRLCAILEAGDETSGGEPW